MENGIWDDGWDEFIKCLAAELCPNCGENVAICSTQYQEEELVPRRGEHKHPVPRRGEHERPAPRRGEHKHPELHHIPAAKGELHKSPAANGELHQSPAAKGDLHQFPATDGEPHQSLELEEDDLLLPPPPLGGDYMQLELPCKSSVPNNRTLTEHKQPITEHTI
ncbi:UNVERIFIED_CONTAM: hypothetical protein FKN15_027397 [Acipenser sinensis]